MYHLPFELLARAKQEELLREADRARLGRRLRRAASTSTRSGEAARRRQRRVNRVQRRTVAG